MTQYVGTVQTKFQTFRVTLEGDHIALNTQSVSGWQKYMHLKTEDIPHFLHCLWVLSDSHDQSVLYSTPAQIPANTFGLTLVDQEYIRLTAQVPNSTTRKAHIDLHISKAQTVVNILVRAARLAGVDITEAQAAHDRREMALWERLEGSDPSRMMDVDLDL